MRVLQVRRIFANPMDVKNSQGTVQWALPPESAEGIPNLSQAITRSPYWRQGHRVSVFIFINPPFNSRILSGFDVSLCLPDVNFFTLANTALRRRTRSPCCVRMQPLQSVTSGHTRAKAGVAKPPVYHRHPLAGRPVTIAGLPDLSLRST